MDLLIGAEELAHQLTQDRLPVIIDTRDEEAYARGHLPGAYHVNGWDLLPEETTMSGLFEFNGDVDQRFRVLGRFEKVHVIVYGDGLDRITGHTFWLMHYAGQLATRLFVPGYDAWVAGGGANTTETPVIDPCPFAVRVRREVIARMDEMEGHVEKKDVPLLDVRDEGEFAAGTVEGAVHFPLSKVLTDDGKAFKSQDELVQVFSEVGIDRRSQAVFLSDRGGRSGIAWVATRLAGFRKCRSFLGGLREWSARD
jgi:3-mercaptopyruvate sulfurtransferase SseA